LSEKLDVEEINEYIRYAVVETELDNAVLPPVYMAAPKGAVQSYRDSQMAVNLVAGLWGVCTRNQKGLPYPSTAQLEN